MDDDAHDPLTAIGRSASSPYEPDRRAALEQLVVALTRRDLRAFVDGAPRITPLPAPLLDVLDRLHESTRSFEQAWHPAFGSLLHVRRLPTPTFVAAVAVELATHAHSLGVGGRWSIALPRPTRVALPAGTQGAIVALEVEAGETGGSGVATMVNDGRRRFTLGDERDAWTAGERSPQVATGALRTTEDDAGAAGEVTVEMQRALAAGLSLIEAASPPYLAWVRGVVRRVIPLARTGPEVRSSSSAHYPGQVSMTLFDSPLDMAETLTHEASHQHYHLLDRCLPLLAAGVTSEHYSPIKRAKRPLPMMLLAFHAFGNVSLLFDELHAHRALTDADYLHHQRDLAQWLPEMAGTLREAIGLTTFGELVWRPLWARAEPILRRVEEALS